jgi:hypothetical protein
MAVVSLGPRVEGTLTAWEARSHENTLSAITDFSKRFARDSSPSGSDLFNGLRTLRSMSSAYPYKDPKDVRLGLPPVVVKDVLARTYEAIDEYHAGGLRAGSFQSKLDRALDVATTQAGIQRFTNNVLTGRAEQSPATDRQALERLFRDALYHTPQKARPLNLGEGYSPEAADQAVTQVAEAIRAYQRSDKDLTDNMGLYHAVEEAATGLDTAAAIANFEALFLKGGKPPPTERLLAAVESLRDATSRYSPSEPHTYEVPLGPEVAQQAIADIRDAIEAYKAEGPNAPTYQLASAIDKSLRALRAEAKRTLLGQIQETKSGPLMALAGERHVTRTKSTRDGSIDYFFDLSELGWGLLGGSRPQEVRTIQLHQSPGSLQAEYQGRRIRLEPTTPYVGSDRLEWSGSTELPNHEYVHLLLRLSPDLTKVESAHITHTTHEGNGVTRSASFSSDKASVVTGQLPSLAEPSSPFASYLERKIWRLLGFRQRR